jgi:hypothetical protein
VCTPKITSWTCGEPVARSLAVGRFTRPIALERYGEYRFAHLGAHLPAASASFYLAVGPLLAATWCRPTKLLKWPKCSPRLVAQNFFRSPTFHREIFGVMHVTDRSIPLARDAEADHRNLFSPISALR